MSNTTSQENETSMQDAEAIAEYLHQNPEFFEQHPDILAELPLTHQVDGAVSLIERQIATLRDQNRSLKDQLTDLILIARDNDNLSERMHHLTLAMMDAETLNEIYVGLDDILRGEFNADAVTVKLFINPEQTEIDSENDLMQTIFVPLDDPQMASFKTILAHEKPVCGELKDEQLSYLFGDNADQIKSSALIPLGGEQCSSVKCSFLGILAIGSHDAKRFSANIGTLFLSNLGDIVSRAIQPQLGSK